MILKRFLLVAFSLVLGFQTVAFSQDDENFKDLKFKDRLFFGGDFALSFGNSSYVNISPIAGYRITPRFSGGLGAIYIYEKSKYYHYETSTYGWKSFLSFDIFKNLNEYLPINLGDIIAHAENEVTNIELFRYDYLGHFYSTGTRIWIDNLLLGGGIRQQIGRRASINLYILWDVTQNTYSPYTNPIIRIGFNF